MFYCEDCRIERDYPESMVKSTGKCEICGELAACNDVPSKFLTVVNPKKEVKLC
jgi:hypothetical protein